MSVDFVGSLRATWNVKTCASVPIMNRQGGQIFRRENCSRVGRERAYLGESILFHWDWCHLETCVKCISMSDVSSVKLQAGQDRLEKVS